jgi:hypothetical protein
VADPPHQTEMKVAKITLKWLMEVAMATFFLVLFFLFNMVYMSYFSSNKTETINGMFTFKILEILLG